MFLCYVDESGTSESPGNTSHFVLAGLSIPIWHWKTCESEINVIKKHYDLESAEIHTGWLLRRYLEQKIIPGFDKLSRQARRSEVDKYRRSELLRLQKTAKGKAFQQAKKNFRKTDQFTHLDFNERMQFVEDIAKTIGKWNFARLFAECIDKVYYDPRRAAKSIDEQAFEQVVSRFEQYLVNTSCPETKKNYGLLIHDNNETVAKKHTILMRSFHNNGTLWTKLNNIIETPLFVNSELTSMVQLADVCAYSIRRYLENKEERLFNHIFQRADKKGPLVVGIRHYTAQTCACKICVSHRSGR